MDRQLIRMNESLESVKTISEVILTLGRWVGLSSSLQNLLITNMESMIHYFKLVTEGYTFGCSETYLRQEAPKGELGCYVLSGIIKPSRMAIRSPDYQNLQALNVISSCHQVADLIATLGSADFVLGSLERSTPVLKKVSVIAMKYWDSKTYLGQKRDGYLFRQLQNYTSSSILIINKIAITT